MVTQKALVAGVAGAFVMIKQSGFEINDDDSVLSYLTLAHIFGRIIEELALAAGANIGYWRVRFFLSFFFRRFLSFGLDCPRRGGKLVFNLVFWC